jgi:ribosomal protein S6
MPAAEANVELLNEQNSYELAFHVLPTVAEGEVPSVFESIKSLITKDGGEIFDEEAPAS